MFLLPGKDGFACLQLAGFTVFRLSCTVFKHLTVYFPNTFNVVPQGSILALAGFSLYKKAHQFS